MDQLDSLTNRREGDEKIIASANRCSTDLPPRGDLFECSASSASEITAKAIKRMNVPQSSATIGLDLRILTYPGHAWRGIGQYTVNHLSRIMQLRPAWRFVGIIEDEKHASIVQTQLDFANLSVIPYEALDSRSLSLFHIPDQISPLFGFDSPLRIAPKLPTTVTCFDLTPLALRETILDNWSLDVQAVYNSRLRQLSSSKCRLLAISEFTKSDLVKRLTIAPERIDVIMAGLNHASVAPKNPQECEAIKARLGIHRPFFLFVGALDVHKNFARAALAFSKIRERLNVQLVVVGSPKDPNRQFFIETLKPLGNDVLFTEFLPRESLDALYASAIALVFPSLYEGFGFPVLEAMAHGCPVVTSNRTSLPEVAGDAAIMVDPEDDDALHQALLQVASDPAVRENLSNKGLRQAKNFSWERTAQLTLNIWEQMLGIKGLPEGKAN